MVSRVALLQKTRWRKHTRLGCPSWLIMACRANIYMHACIVKKTSTSKARYICVHGVYTGPNVYSPVVNAMTASMANNTVRVPVTMSAVLANNTTASYDLNTQTYTGYTVTLTAGSSVWIESSRNTAESSPMISWLCVFMSAIQDMVRSKYTHRNYNGVVGYYLEDQHHYGDTSEPGNGGSVSYGAPVGNLGHLDLSVDYIALGPNASARALAGVLRGGHP